MNLPSASGQASGLGILCKESDVGIVAKAGLTVFNSARGQYRIRGGGENMWATNDAFHFVWKKMSGDLKLAARIQFPGTNGNPHRKACLLGRPSLAPNAAYANVAFHGNGLTSLQNREEDGGVTRETVSRIVQAGAELLVAGNAIFGAGRPEEDVRTLLALARQAAGE